MAQACTEGPREGGAASGVLAGVGARAAAGGVVGWGMRAKAEAVCEAEAPTRPRITCDECRSDIGEEPFVGEVKDGRARWALCWRRECIEARKARAMEARRWVEQRGAGERTGA